MSTPIRTSPLLENQLNVSKSVLSTAIKPSSSSKNKFRILSLDGGGIRGIIPATILAEMEKKLQTETGNPTARIIDQFDLVAGTSAGAILACLYTVRDDCDPNRPKFSAQEILDCYLNGGCNAFNTLAPEGSRTEKYCSASLEAALKHKMGEDIRLDQLLKPVVITAYNFDQQMPVIFESWKGNRPLAWEVARASAAAPGMFQPKVISGLGEDQFIDGSIFASNPAMCAYTAIGSLCATHKSYAKTTIISIGTGKTLSDPTAKRTSIFRTLMATMMTSGGDLVHQQLKQLFDVDPNGSYFRLNPILPAAAIDQASQADMLLEAGRKYLQSSASLVRTLLREIC